MKFSKIFLTTLLTFTTTCQPVFAGMIRDNEVTTAKIKDAAVTRAKLATGAKSKELYVTAAADHTLDTTVTDILEMTCSSACDVDLPTAVGIQGYQVTIIHAGSQFVPITLDTTASQTVGGVADSSYKLYTIGERLTIYSDNVNWKIRSHDGVYGGDWIDLGDFMDFFTFTITSGSATIQSTYVPAYVFTITAGNATAAATYTNNGATYTVASTIAGGTTLVTTSPSTAATSLTTLTKASGTGDATLTFSARAGNASGVATFTTAKTVASGTTYIADSTTDGHNSSGRLVKTGGSGDTVLVYSAYTGAKNTTNTTNGATRAIFYGDPTTNSWRGRRNGKQMVFEGKWYQTVAGPVAGTNDLLLKLPVAFPLPIDTTAAPVFSTGTGGLSYTTASHDKLWNGWANGTSSINASAECNIHSVTPYSTTQVRVYCDYVTGDRLQPWGASATPGNAVMSMNLQFEMPIDGFQP